MTESHPSRTNPSENAADASPAFPKIMRYEEYLAHHSPQRAAAKPGKSVKHSVNVPVHARFIETHEDAGHDVPPAATTPLSAITTEPADELTGHNYDGIEEYDNPTPGWWYLVFAGSFVFSILYLMVYQLAGIFPTPIQRHAMVQARADELRFAELSKIPMSEDKILQIMEKPVWLAQGQGIFEGTCAVCHQADGRGSVGPNLTDDKYKNITTLMDIPAIITNGAGNGAMPPQLNKLNENEIALVAAYAASLRGKNLPTGEGVRPELTGVPIAPWPTRTPEAASSQSSN